MEPVHKKAKLNTQDFAIRHEMIRNGQCELSIYDDPVSGIWRITYKFIDDFNVTYGLGIFLLKKGFLHKRNGSRDQGRDGREKRV